MDIVALYGALAGVAAITTALQTTAVFVSFADVAAIEGKYDTSRPDTQKRADAQSDANGGLDRALILNLPGLAVNGCVIAAWGDVSLVRSDVDWVLVLPWASVVAMYLFLVLAVLGLRERLVAVRDGKRNPS